MYLTIPMDTNKPHPRTRWLPSHETTKKRIKQLSAHHEYMKIMSMCNTQQTRETIMFHGHLDYLQKPSFGGRPDTKLEDHGILNARNR
jgi:hypothetical protein